MTDQPTGRLAFTAPRLTSVPAQPSIEGPLLGHEILGDGPEKVIVLHDWLGNAETWNPVKPYLDTETFTFVFTEVRGYGRSQGLSGAYTAAEIANDVRRLVGYLGYGAFHLIAHSMTGMAAHRLAVDAVRDASLKLGKVIAVTPITAAGYPASDADRDFFAAIPHNPDVTTAAFDGLTGGRYLNSWSRHKASLNIASATERSMQGYREMVVDGGFFDEARSVQPTTPMLVIGGRHDLPGAQEDYLREVVPKMFPNAKIRIIEASGHYPMDETPIQLATFIDEFLKD